MYCISNTLHRAGTELNERNQRRSRPSNTGERAFTAEQKLKSSGIPVVRDFISGIPFSSHREETKHYLDVQVLTLIQLIRLWLNARIAGEAAVGPEEPGLLKEIQTELRSVGVIT